MSQKKSGGTTKNGRDSISKRLGVKIFGGQKISSGQIIVRQRGTAFRAGKNVKRSSDDTLIALKDGVVKFSTRKLPRFTGQLKKMKIVSVL